MGFFTELALWLGSFQFLPDPCTSRTCCEKDPRRSSVSNPSQKPSPCVPRALPDHSWPLQAHPEW